MMLINQDDYDELCDIARTLNEEDIEDINTFHLWERLNEVISNVKEIKVKRRK